MTTTFPSLPIASGRFAGFSLTLGILGGLLGLMVLIGWHTEINFLVQLRPYLGPMTYNSALLLLLAGSTLTALLYHCITLARTLAGVSLAFSALTMLQYFLGTDFGIDELFLHHHIPTGDLSAPGRMALSSAFCYLMLNVGFLVFTVNRGRWHSRAITTVCAAVVIAVVVATLIGYRGNFQPLFGWSASTFMPLQTVVGIFMVSLGLLIHCLTSAEADLGEYDHLPTAAAGFIVIASASLLLWSGLTREHDDQRQQEVETNTRLLSNGINSLFREHIGTIDRFGTGWNAWGGIPESVWNILMNSYFESLPALQAVALLTPDGALSRQRNRPDSLLGDILQAPAALHESCLSLNGSNRGVFSASVFEPAENDSHFFNLVPLYIGEQFAGCILAEISTLPFFETVNLQNSGIAYRVEQDDNLVYSSPLDRSRSGATLSVVSSLPLPGIHWTLQVADTGSTRDVQSLLPIATLILGLLLATLLAAILGLWGISRRQLAQVARSNLAIAANKMQLDEFRTTLDRTLDCVFMLDAATLKYYYANAGALQLTGLSYAEIIGKHPWESNRALTEARFRLRIIPLLNKDVDSLTYETIQLHPNGSETPVECFLQYIAPDQEAPRFVALLRDITERKRVERMKSEFVSTVSHELRTPLTSITGALGLVKGGALGEVPIPVLDMIDIAYQNGRRLTHLINDLLDIERLAAGRINFDMQLQALTPLVEQAIADISTYGNENNVSVRLNNLETGIEVRIDSQRLLQIFGNLLSNAIKFSPPASVVEVTIERRTSKVRISVRDHGRGIPEAFKVRIFQKFAQADSSDTKRQNGTGLGLAISRELAERMGGYLAFDSKPGEGAVFYLELPIGNYHLDQPAAGGPRILIVEDEPDAALLLQKTLYSAGFHTSIATTGKDALATLQADTWVAVVIDLALPDMDGIELIRTIKATALTAMLPIIVVSAHAEAGRLQMEGDDLGIRWLSKPVESAELLSHLEKLVSPSGLEL